MLSIFTVFRRKKSVECFGRRVEEGAVRTAACVLMMYVTFTIGATLIVSYLDGLPVQEVLFESTSAIATVGAHSGDHAAAQHSFPDSDVLVNDLRTGRLNYDSAGVYLNTQHADVKAADGKDQDRIGH